MGSRYGKLKCYGFGLWEWHYSGPLPLVVLLLKWTSSCRARRWIWRHYNDWAVGSDPADLPNLYSWALLSYIAYSGVGNVYSHPTGVEHSGIPLSRSGGERDAVAVLERAYKYPQRSTAYGGAAYQDHCRPWRSNVLVEVGFAPRIRTWSCESHKNKENDRIDDWTTPSTLMGNKDKREVVSHEGS